MSVKLKPYPAMKDSGAPWLGKVPEHWETWRLKYLLHERDSRSADGREQLLCVSQYTGVTQRLSSDGTEEPDTRAASLVGYRRVQANELVVNIMLAWNGSMGVSRYDGIASPAYCVYRFVPSANPWYFHHLLRSPTYKAHIKTVSTGVVESRLRLYSDDLYKIEALLPPLPEQSAIVRFLDHADRRIRRYIRAKQKLIKLLEEQKQAIIHRAVTRGLDPNVRLKPSGVPWLGDVPEHWEVRKLRSLFRRHGSGTTPAGDAYYGGGIPWIMTGDLTDTVVSETKRSVTKQALMDVSALRLYPAGSLAVAMYGATIGKTGVFWHGGLHQSSLLRPCPPSRHCQRAVRPSRRRYGQGAAHTAELRRGAAEHKCGDRSLVADTSADARRARPHHARHQRQSGGA